MPWVHGDWIEDDDEADSEAGAWAFEPYVRQLFKRAGWQPLPRPAPVAAGDAMAYATSLLEEFGGLIVGEAAPDSDRAEANIRLLRAPEPVREHWIACWPRLGTAAWIAVALDTYVDVLVDAKGDFLVIAEIDERLYNFGSDFVRLAETLLRGLDWPLDVEDAP